MQAFDMTRDKLDADSVSASEALRGRDENGFTALQSAFIDAYCENGGDGKAAAITAGYGVGGDNMATRNLLKPKIQAEIERRIKSGKGTALVHAMDRLLKIVDNGTDERAAVQAALGLLDRFGMSPPRGPAVQVNQQFNMTGSEAQKIIADVTAKRLERIGQPARSTQIEHVQTVDAQPVQHVASVVVSDGSDLFD